MLAAQGVAYDFGGRHLGPAVKHPGLLSIGKEEDYSPLLMHRATGDMGQGLAPTLQPEPMQVDPRQSGLIIASNREKNLHVRRTDCPLVFAWIGKRENCAVRHRSISPPCPWDRPQSPREP